MRPVIAVLAALMLVADAVRRKVWLLFYWGIDVTLATPGR